MSWILAIPNKIIFKMSHGKPVICDLFEIFCLYVLEVSFLHIFLQIIKIIVEI